jgi:hypothetical protein
VRGDQPIGRGHATLEEYLLVRSTQDVVIEGDQPIGWGPCYSGRVPTCQEYSGRCDRR